MSARSVFSRVALFTILGALVLVSCKEDPPAPTLYSGTLTVLQKDAYSSVPGRSSELWPPHTTTVFEWNAPNSQGGESLVQINHGTSPGEMNSQGDVLLTTTKVYLFSGTQEVMEALEAAYMQSVCDNGQTRFLGLHEAETILEETFIAEVRNFLFEDEDFLCTGTPTDTVLAWLEAGELQKFLAIIEDCNYTIADWEIAFELSLIETIEGLQHTLDEYHVCNNDAIMQVDLIRNYNSNGTIEVPQGDCAGPMWYYTPN